MSDVNALVSIIIPVYNTGDYLIPCLDSVLNQTYSNLEILVVDDKSTDQHTLDLLHMYAAKDPRVQLMLSQENTGCGGSRNKAVAICQGKYLTFLDSDDHLSLDYVERMVQAIEKYQADFVICHAQNFAQPSTTVQFDEKELFFPPQNKEFFTTKEFINTHQLLSVPIMPFAKLFDTQKYKKANITFIPKMFAQDHDWTLRLFCELESFAIVDFAGVYRLVRDESCCHKISKHLCESVVRALRLRYQILQQHGYFEMYRIDFFKEVANYFVRLSKQIPDLEQQQAYMQQGFDLLEEFGYPIKDAGTKFVDQLNQDPPITTERASPAQVQTCVTFKNTEPCDALSQAMTEFFVQHQVFLQQTQMLN